MNLYQLKDRLSKNSVPEELIIFKCESDFYLADQYVAEMCRRSGKPKNLVKTLSETLDSAVALVMSFEDNLNVVKTETFDEAATNYGRYSNCVVICNKIDKKLENILAPYVIEVPAVKDWQMKDYIKAYCDGLSDNAVEWLYKYTNGDYYRITNELDKLLLFPKELRQKTLAELRDDPNTDLYVFKTYDLVDALILGTRPNVLLSYLKHKKVANLDGIALYTQLLNKLKNILLLVYNPGTTPASLGMKDGQAYYLRKDFCGQSEAKLMRNIEFLSGLDLKLKTGKLDMSNDDLVSYVINNILA